MVLKDRLKTDTCIIHCSLTKPSQDIDIRWMDKLHRQKGYQYGIGYHYFIKRDGTIQEGRPLLKIGAHCPGWDTRSIGICVAGGVEEEDGKSPEDNFTPAQFESLALLIDLMKTEFPGIKPYSYGQLIPGQEHIYFESEL
jgi:N-acetylmuramoyl-L-alanine amidase